MDRYVLGPLEIIRWSVRLLYLELFISLMIVLNLWHIPLTFAFVGSVLSLTIPVLLTINEDKVKKELFPSPQL